MQSPNWTLNKGAATWGSGATGVTGTISTSNSLIGSTGGDEVGLDVTALTNGNYVVGSPDWALSKGAATFGSGSVGVKGTIASSNSLTGSTVGDQVGLNITALTNGNYVVQSPLWNGTIGAASWASGTLGLTGTISSSNSLIGSTVADEVGLHVTALTDGNYIVGNPLWDLTLGAATFGNGTLGTCGIVSSANSLVGSLVGDLVGSSVTALNSGAYVIGSFGWNGGLGAATFGLADTALTGTLTTANSIIGTTTLTTPLVTIKSVAATGNFTVTFGGGTGSVYEGFTNPNQLIYSADQDGIVTIAPSFITQVLNTGTSVTMQANDDIIVNSAITTSAGGNGGALTFQAGRSILINNNITTDNGALTLTANDTLADGVVNNERDTGAGIISMSVGTSLNAGTGAVSITSKTGAGITNASAGNITLNNVTGRTISVVDQSQKTLTLNGALTASASGDSIVLSSGILTNNDGASALNPGLGRYVLYSIDPTADTLNGLSGFTKHYGISYTLDPPSDYTSGGDYSLYSITPTLTISGSNATRVYGSANPTLSYTSSGLIDGDSIATALVAAPVLTTSATTSSNVGTYSISLANTLSSSLGYNIVVNNGTLSVTPANLTITPGSASRFYGSANPSFTASYSGFVNGDTSSAVSGLSLSTGATITSNVGSYAIIGSGASAANYTVSYGANGMLTINQAPLTITANNASRFYGSANPAFTATYSGLVNGDSSGVVTNLMLSTAATSASNVGNYVINAQNAAATNYVITYVNGTLSVTPAALTITANSSSRVYGASNPSFSASYTGLVNNDTSSIISGLSLTTSATSSSNVGAYAIVASGASSNNYVITYGTNGMLSITPAALTITANNSSRIYSASNPAFSPSYTGLVNGDTSTTITGLSLTTSATTASNVGSYAITASGATDANYTISYGTGILTIGQAALTITANNASRLYGSANPAFTATYSGLVNGDGSGVVTNLLLGTSATTASNVGSYAISASNASATNYVINYVNGTLSVSPAPLTITANNSSRLYGANNPAFSATYSGLVNGDTTSAITGLSLTTTATSASNVGTYAITGIGATAQNYMIAYGPSGTLSVTPASLTITSNDASRVYGAGNPTLAATYTGLVNGDTSSAITGLSLTTSATNTSNVGTYAIAASGAVSNNYVITYGANGMLSITPAALVITADNSTKVYGAANPALSATYSGLVNGDTSNVINNLSLSTTATSASNVGSYVISASGGTDANYTISYGPNATMLVTPAALTISTINSSRVYGQANPTFSATYSGLVNGDTSTAVTGLELSTNATSTSNVGSYAITASGGNASNYAITYGAGGMLTVTPASLTITPNSSTRLYGSANVFSASFSGLTAGDTSAAITGLTLSSTATQSSNVGTYTITAAGGVNSNYSIAYGPSATLIVTPAPLTITPDNSTRLPGTTNTLDATVTGLVNGDTVSAISNLSLATTATQSSPIGDYPIIAWNATSSNYNINYGPNATLAIVALLPQPSTPAPVLRNPDTDPVITVMPTVTRLMLTNGPVKQARYRSTDNITAQLNQVMVPTSVNQGTFNAPFIAYDGMDANNDEQAVCLKVSLDNSGGGADRLEESCSAPLTLRGF